MIPYGRHLIDEDDIRSVSETLVSHWLTTGPKVSEFEAAVAAFVHSEHAVAVSSGTAALHTAMHCLGIGSGDEVIVPAITFVATANAVVFCGGTPVFADVDLNTLLINPKDVEAKITSNTRAIVAVDYAGQPCDYDALRGICERHGLVLVADACHSLGATQGGIPASRWADIAVFSFHPVKHITTGEGGMVVTNRADWAKEARMFRNHGIETDHREREHLGTWAYDMVKLGYNYRITDIQCALGISQLKKLPRWIAQRRRLSEYYSQLLADIGWLEPLKQVSEGHVWHLYVIKLQEVGLRQRLFHVMRQRGVGVNVHYLPVHLHSFYRNRFGTGQGLCPVAESAYEHILTLPLHQGMTETDVEYVVQCLKGFEYQGLSEVV
ncbi:MAG: UDP-4-amino-4,6-dideoxy-N-acetyl-beta-L-altrosamine transaminase [Dissulfuribacterales bacterium]